MTLERQSGDWRSRVPRLTLTSWACYGEKLFWPQCAHWAPGLLWEERPLQKAGATVEGAFRDHGPNETGSPRRTPA
jgi:hypothetical protein